jgi:hypothetical protein
MSTKTKKPCGNCGKKRTASRASTTMPPTRPSCMECVEKHLGAALVLLTETRDGYDHRLRAIGHLFEAEDESQEWPALHVAIREARRAYQSSGAMPDWRHLAMLAHALQTGTAPAS